MATHYAWSEIRFGGEVDNKKAPGGRDVKVVTKRNVVEWGSKVTQKDLGVDKDEWQHLIDTGSVRPYPPPKGANENTSPTTALMTELVDSRGEIDVNRLMEMGLTVPPPASMEDEEPSTTTPVGA